MAYFLSREEPAARSGKKCMQSHGNMSSGYGGNSNGARSPSPPVHPVHQRNGKAAHHQAQDPNSQKHTSNGYRVSQASGGRNSPRPPLAWDEPSRGLPDRQRTGGAAQPPAAQSGINDDDCTPYNARENRNGNRGSGRGLDDNRMAGCVDDPVYPDSCGRPAVDVAGPPSVQAIAGRNGLSQQAAYAINANRQRGSGNHGGSGSGGLSYGGASGNGGQNVGNSIGNRNSSRVLAPPGGFSSFSLG